nr:metastasis-suppressor KiSS-1 [Aotus nancymaae]
MNSLVAWQLLLFLCAIHFAEPSETAPVENPRPAGQQLGTLALLVPWEQNLRSAQRKPAATARLSRALCAPSESSGSPQQTGPCAPSSRQIPAPRSEVEVQRELPPPYWNVFSLRYG